MNVRSAGAKGNGITDDTEALVYAIRNADTIVIPKGTYLISRRLQFSGLSNKTILATGAVITNDNNLTGTIQFEKGKNITVNGGTWTRTVLPVKEGKGEEHTFTFINIDNVKVSGVTVKGSPEMGIALVNVNTADIENNHISSCFRDGIYAHYSVKLSYINNKLDNIKDDAMSIHDYGIPDQKKNLTSAGFKQAGYSRVLNNTVNNCYQGFASIGCSNITVDNNQINNTVNAGIAILNSETIFKGSDARANHIIIKNNVLTNNGGKQTIINIPYFNYGQLTTGRSALFIGVTDADNLINNPKSRLNNITVTGNKVQGSFVNGAYVAQIDHLIFTNNSFTNCNTSDSPYCGNIVEIENCTDADISENDIIDNRVKKHHINGFKLNNVTGTINNWKVKGFIKAAGSVFNIKS
ncbi:right-handed parallel beta-helix repeat-containing protein [Mucilaginibacter segetis]|uniref:Rhamnogalacturonase A/B/Epimerase-like pectate lyase domain-containing protein n=1 Tax=Mucilaginibacter segetis TaxID=2793071 RepID=A0A934PY11_9SPHI|nr:right-handed parallel beta-helix repeat-containing protein [Mucilaginibacter segetis]MBK0381146.1 hypothetical protein [Mucilaginibacter segetis]